MQEESEQNSKIQRIINLGYLATVGEEEWLGSSSYPHRKIRKERLCERLHTQKNSSLLESTYYILWETGAFSKLDKESSSLQPREDY